MQTLACNCAHCGAPLSLQAGSTVALCLFCRGSNVITAGGGGGDAPVASARPALDRETSDAIIQLTLDGQREQAVALYARAMQVDMREAGPAVDGLTTSLVQRLGRKLPISWGAVPILLAIVGGLVAGAVLCILQAMQGSAGLGVLAPVLLVLALLQLRFLVVHTYSRLVDTFGTQGTARLLRVAVIKPGYRKGGTLIVVHWEIRPASGAPPFYDDEPLLVTDASLAKLQPGNVIAVRFDRGRALVFPTSPVTVVGQE